MPALLTPLNHLPSHPDEQLLPSLLLLEVALVNLFDAAPVTVHQTTPTLTSHRTFLLTNTLNIKSLFLILLPRIQIVSPVAVAGSDNNHHIAGSPRRLGREPLQSLTDPVRDPRTASPGFFDRDPHPLSPSPRAEAAASPQQQTRTGKYKYKYKYKCTNTNTNTNTVPASFNGLVWERPQLSS